MEFNKKIYQLRKEKGLSQDELGGKLNVSRQTISKWELGESTPEMEKLIAISDYFQISLDSLVLGKETKEKESVPADKKALMLETVFTDTNKKKAKKGLKIVAIILGILVAIDIISLVIYFILYLV